MTVAFVAKLIIAVTIQYSSHYCSQYCSRKHNIDISGAATPGSICSRPDNHGATAFYSGTQAAELDSEPTRSRYGIRKSGQAAQFEGEARRLDSELHAVEHDIEPCESAESDNDFYEAVEARCREEDAMNEGRRQKHSFILSAQPSLS